MAFDQTTRNRLSRFVTDARTLLSDEFRRQLQHEYGLDPKTGEVTDLAKLGHLDDARRETAVLLRETMEHYLAGSDATGVKARKEVLDRIVREQAFTVLNRLCALRMAEARGLLIESVARGYQSKGFQLYGRLAGTALGETGDAYRTYLLSIFDEFAVDLPVLFDRFSPEGRLFPREATLLEVLAEVNHTDIDALWAEDETIGWIYQYFNSKDERKAMRDASAAPRNSRELAVRNQFFTPRYVVEFLTDNTLGRIWYEMTRGDTALKEECRYLVRRPNEVFLQPGEAAPETPQQEDLGQEELLRQPVHIPHRPLKDPRDLKMLDPACGSMHFGLYAFDLFERIYEEAWEIEETKGADALLRSDELKPLRDTYADRDTFQRDVPRLIIERNIHGIDIDPRAVQIAGLSLWLRAQRSWQGQGLKPQQRPQIQRSNVVCAEPMPGEEELLEEFIEGHLSATPEHRLLGRLFRQVVDAMKLAGEAGSLLRTEAEIADAVAEAKERWVISRGQGQHSLISNEEDNFGIADIPGQNYWEEAEERIYAALQSYAESVQNGGGGYQRRLFVDDAALGFACIELCRKRYDVVLMNPPFGLAPPQAFEYTRQHYPRSYTELLATFVERAIELSIGRVGAITSRAFMVASRLKGWRHDLVAPTMCLLADIGENVMDGAFVEAAAYVLDKQPVKHLTAIDCRNNVDVEESLSLSVPYDPLRSNVYTIATELFAFFPNTRIIYSIDPKIASLLKGKERFEPTAGTARQGLTTWDDFRFVRLLWEVEPEQIGPLNVWEFLSKGGAYSRYLCDIHLLMKWNGEGLESRAINIAKAGTDAQAKQASDYWRRPGLTYSIRSQKGFSARVMPEGCLFTGQGPLITSESAVSNLHILGWLNSVLVTTLIEIQSNDGKFMSGVIKSLPWKEPDVSSAKCVADLEANTAEVLQKLIEVDSWREVSPYFRGFKIHPTITATLDQLVRSHKAAIHAVSNLDHAWNNLVEEQYGVDKQSIDSLRSQLSFLDVGSSESAEDLAVIDLIPEAFCKELLSIVLGAAFGRWAVQPESLGHPEAKILDPFSRLPACAPGTLKNIQGFPAAMAELPTTYPLRIPWSGILVDDAGTSDDIEDRLRQVLRVVWQAGAEAIEHEGCDILGVRSIREYFTKSTSFFSDHLKRYSESRRQAPIYWPLSTPSGSYTLWLYYHRLTDQTLYICVNDYVEPKLKQIAEEAAGLRSKSGRSSAEERQLERLSTLEGELKDFRDELLRITKFWKPNLNDGVQITAAPLWKLFQHKAWQKKLKETWEKLEAGDYDWAHLAYSIWPDRVREKCRTDKSLAIAHGLEDLYEEPKTAPKKKRGRREQDEEDEEFAAMDLEG
jgi:hypothetical protein